jgi:tRNA(Ile2) C34 agmatinyltransferase TiaS
MQITEAAEILAGGRALHRLLPRLIPGHLESAIALGTKSLTVSRIVDERLSAALVLLPVCPAGETRDDAAGKCVGCGRRLLAKRRQSAGRQLETRFRYADPMVHYAHGLAHGEQSHDSLSGRQQGETVLDTVTEAYPWRAILGGCRRRRTSQGRGDRQRCAACVSTAPDRETEGRQLMREMASFIFVYGVE